MGIGLAATSSIEALELFLIGWDIKKDVVRAS